MVDYVAILEDAQVWSPSEQDALREWYRTYLRWLLTSQHGQDESGQPNNHGTGYDVQVATLALFVGDQSSAREVLSQAPERRHRRALSVESIDEFKRELPSAEDGD